MATEQASKHLRDLKTKRRAFKGQITMFGTWVEGYVDSPQERAKLWDRMQRLRKQFDTFNEIQDELATIEKFEEVEAERYATTDLYDDVMANATVLLERLETRATQPSPVDTESSTSPYALAVRLPKIDLPKFDGRTEKWITFKDAFHTLIHTQSRLSNVQKLHYLRLSLSGKAEQAIEAFSITEQNYNAAWEHLCEIYDNKRVLVLRHAALLRDTPAMPDNSSESVRDLANHMQLHVRSLLALGRTEADFGNDLLASILISKMSNDTRTAWERTLSDTEVPNIHELFKFLNNASHQSKDCDSSNHRDTSKRSHPPRPQVNRPHTPPSPRQRQRVFATTTSRSESPSSPRERRRTPPSSPRERRRTPPSSPREQRRTPPSSPREQRRTPPTSPPRERRRTPPSSSSRAPRRPPPSGHTEKCPECSGEHPLYLCPRFRDNTVAQRIEVVRKTHVCYNCLRSNHRTEDCTARGCRVCGKQHNTKLHQDRQDA
ncbi:unnamed protein product [Xylocopa violacea]|uniref:CCHC-type domain-containing protein n=1 Tax=Xylocopa violacea TaxID=135666 RepID=A0ABP1N1J8_XYLVO